MTPQRSAQAHSRCALSVCGLKHRLPPSSVWGPAPTEPPAPTPDTPAPGSRCPAPPPRRRTPADDRAPLVTSQRGPGRRHCSRGELFTSEGAWCLYGRRGTLPRSVGCAQVGDPCPAPTDSGAGPFHPALQCAMCTVPCPRPRAHTHGRRLPKRTSSRAPSDRTPQPYPVPLAVPRPRSARAPRPRVPPATAAGARTQLPVPQGNSCRHSFRKCSRTAALTVPGGASMAARPSRPAGC